MSRTFQWVLVIAACTVVAVCGTVGWRVASIDKRVASIEKQQADTTSFFTKMEQCLGGQPPASGSVPVAGVPSGGTVAPSSPQPANAGKWDALAQQICAIKNAPTRPLPADPANNSSNQAGTPPSNPPPVSPVVNAAGGLDTIEKEATEKLRQATETLGHLKRARESAQGLNQTLPAPPSGI